MPLEIANNSAGSIVRTGATLYGQVVEIDDTVGNPTLTVYYGLTDGGAAFDSWDSNVSLGEKGTGVWDQAVSDLLKGRQYFFRFYATDGTNEAWAPDTLSFVTLAEFGAYRTILVAAANGVLYYEDSNGEMQSISGNVDLSQDAELQSVAELQKLYIADYSDNRVSGSDGTISGATLDASGVSDWTTYGIDVDNDVALISEGTNDVTDGTYLIDSVAAGSVTLASSPGTSGNCSYRILRSPKVFDPTDNSLSIWTATDGQVPCGCPLIARYRDRLVLAGDPETPHLWFMSRQGDPLDFDYGTDSDDTGRAMAGQNSDAGDIGEGITALIPHTDDYLIIAGTKSVWVLRGDPAFGGELDRFSDVVGIVGPNAWCSLPDGSTIFLSRDGIYRLAAGAESYPQSVSREVLPARMLNIDHRRTRATLCYDYADRGVHIFLTEIDQTPSEHYWLDLETESFWRYSYQRQHSPHCSLLYQADDPGESSVVLGCTDGYLRKISSDASTDDGYGIDSHVVYGPMRTGGNDFRTGVVLEIIGELAEDSNDVQWSCIVADTMEACAKKYNMDILTETGDSLITEDYSKTITTETNSGIFIDGRWFGGLNHKVRPHARGGAYAIAIEGRTQNLYSETSNDILTEDDEIIETETAFPFTLERMTAALAATGKQRRMG